MDQYAEHLIGRYRSAGVLVDTNLLLLYFIGRYDQGLIERWGRTNDRFVSVDYDTLLLLLERFDTLVVTPHVLTEVSNLLGYLNEPARSECRELFGQTIRSLMDEKRTSGDDLSEHRAFLPFGIADASVADAAAGSYLVLTDDLDLYGYLENEGVGVLNFNEIRSLAY
ncbi:MAG: hypothetical protein H0X71_00460 [Rubrobacter sp.]|nr:hypothetical protein [Rubrobacter sp.]